jgi:hypothetical protein
MAFEVRDVLQHEVDVGELGKALTGARVSRDSPAAAIFFNEPKVRMLVMTRTLTSRQFSVRSSTQGGQALDLSVDAIKDVIGKADATIKWKRESDGVVSFEGAEPVTFAFAAVPCVTKADGSFYFGLEADQVAFAAEAPAPAESMTVFDVDGLLELDGD